MVASVPKKRKMTAREAAEKYGVSISTIMNRQAEPREVFEQRARDRRDVIFTMWESGREVQEIADEFGKSYASIQGVLRRALIERGLPPTVSRKRHEIAEIEKDMPTL